jgi:hypothetical protein
MQIVLASFDKRIATEVTEIMKWFDSVSSVILVATLSSVGFGSQVETSVSHCPSASGINPEARGLL